MEHRPYALVLSGGGAKGSYQIGVWKALRELDIQIEAVIGTSVGALNATLIAQNDFEKAWKIWDTMSLENIVELPVGMIQNGKLSLSKQYRPTIKDIKDYVLQHSGLNTTPLKQFIDKHLNEKKIKENKIDLGLVTYNLKKLKPLEIFYSDMEQGKLQDYLLASASFPIFKSHEIDGIKYIDGGIYDNIPFASAVKRGYSQIIVVDISGRGRNKKHNIERTSTIYIKNSIDMGGVFDFNPEIMSNYRNLGYLDTLKIFGMFDGIYYFYNKDTELTNMLEQKINELLSKEKRSLQQVLPRHLKFHKEPILACMECCAIGLGIPSQINYTMQELVNAIKDKYILLKKSKATNNKQELSNYKRSLTSKMKNLNSKPMFKFSASDYDMVLKQILMDKKKGIFHNTLSRFFPELPATRLFVCVLDYIHM